ncbi:MAG: carbohydrate ABC transporter permease [Aeriscardovia aeriphila]|nr:carbohydrate ABC transporter permease [Aeriscardovia aeriphila]
MNVNETRHPKLWTVFFSILSLLWIYPLVLVLINSFKKKIYISANPFSFPSGSASNPKDTAAGLQNYTIGIQRTDFFNSFLWSVVITVGAVALILICCSMCAWWIVRVNNWAARLLYTLFLFNMIVPFQMVMFTLSNITDELGLANPWGLWIIYLGFGAGLAVFIFTGTVKGIPVSLEESAMIDGASVPQIFFQIVVPIMKPSIVSVGILETMWIWNDYLLPYLTLDLNKYKTIPIAVQYLRGGYGSIDMGAMMGCLVLAIVPIVLFYVVCQKYIVKGVLAGAVKG